MKGAIRRLSFDKNESFFVSKIVIGQGCPEVAMRNASEQEYEYENEGAKVILYKAEGS